MFELCCGITIFNGGTFGPAAALNDSPVKFLSSISTSLSVLAAVGFGLADGLFRSNVATFLLVKFEFFAAVPWNLEFFSWRCDCGRFDADLFKSFDAVASVTSLRFFRLISSSPSPSISEYERFVP